MSILLERDGILFAGDAVVTCFPPIIQDGSADDEIQSLELILALDFDYLVPGHGPVLERETARRHCQASLDYLRSLRDCLDTVLADDRPLAELLAVAAPALNHLPEGLEAVAHWHKSAVERIWQQRERRC
jgi:glyoxylase-like metal-dependent hydrolase (beta-lactamase superfamily II)